MSIAFDAASSAPTVQGGTQISWSHTCSGNHRLLVVGILHQSNTMTGVTYNGVAMNYGWGGSFQNAGNFYWVSYWWLRDPASGTHTIVGTSSVSTYLYCVAASYTNVSEAAQPAAGWNNSDTQTLFVDTDSPDATIIAICEHNNATIDVMEGYGTNRVVAQNGGGMMIVDRYVPSAGGSTVGSTGGQWWINLGIAWKPYVPPLTQQVADNAFVSDLARIPKINVNLHDSIRGYDVAYSTELSRRIYDVIAIRDRRTGPGLSDFEIQIGGIDRTALVDLDTVDIMEDSYQMPNTATFETFGFQPNNNDEVTIRAGTDYEFRGIVTRNKEDHPRITDSRQSRRVTCTDGTYDLKGVLITAKFGASSASDVATAILASLPFGYTASVDGGLPAIDGIQFKMTTLDDALSQLCDAFGGGWSLTMENVVHVFLVDTTTSPAELNAENLDWRSYSREAQIEGLYNRVLIEGAGGIVQSDIAAGETIIPFDSVENFEVGGGQATAGNDVIAYTGLQGGGGGAGVGFSVAPSVALGGAAVAGSGIESGDHDYAYTWTTGAGETLPSPLKRITFGSITPPNQCSAWNATGQYETSDEMNGWDVGDLVEFAYSYGSLAEPPSNSTTRSPIASVTAVANPYGYHFHWPDHPSPKGMYVRINYSTSSICSRIFLWYRINGGAWKVLGWTTNYILNYQDRSYIDWYVFSPSLIAGTSSDPTNPAFRSFIPRDVAIGPSGVTGRKIYRTSAGGSQLKLQQTISDNTSTQGATDATADGSLGADAPTTDTSGLSTVEGTVLAGSTEMIVSGISFGSPGGGWARVGGSQVIRYTNISGSSLTGIPASGPGAIVATVQYGTAIVALPAITGVSGLTNDLANGESVNLLVQRDDVLSQSRFGRIRRKYLQDRRLSANTARQLADAELIIARDEAVSAMYRTEDTAVHPGAVVSINMPEWNRVESLRIKSVRKFFDPDRVAMQREVTLEATATDRDLYAILRRLQRDARQ